MEAFQFAVTVGMQAAILFEVMLVKRMLEKHHEYSSGRASDEAGEGCYERGNHVSRR